MLHRIQAGGIAATVKTDGAELCALRDGAGRDWLWDAGPAWPRHAPVLFPIVGRLVGDTLRHADTARRLNQHGFARDRRFDWLSRDEASCRLRLEDDAETRAAYPFRFALEIGYAVEGATLTQDFCVANPANTPLPASLGAHPAFRWPLPGAPDAAGHTLTFAQDEPAPIRRLEGGLLREAAEPNPVRDRVLRLDAALFEADAIIMDAPASRALRYSGPGGATLELAWEGFEQLGLWCKPGAGFLCIEPWHGFASPVGWDGEFAEKPGVFLVPPGGERRFRLTITLG